jgi:uncharacterized membrane protein
MTFPNITNPITSTRQLTWDGIWGYRKAIGAFLAVVVSLVAKAWADGSITSAEWRDIAIASVSGAIATYLLPNAIKPTPPAPVVPEEEAPLV